MRNRFSQDVEDGRIRSGQFATPTGVHHGAFMIKAPSGATLRIIISDGGGWDHVSVSLPDRCPTWDEMDFVKRQFFKPDEVVMQLHVAEADHINYHEFCLHLWRPMKNKIPLPPPEMVGPQKPE